MEGWIMSDIRTSALGGIPFGNSANRPTGSVGQPYFNGEEKRLELYTATGWQNIVSETPGVVSVSGTYNESAASATLEITGTNFSTGAVASATGTNGIEINASSTTVNSIVSVTAVFSGLQAIYEPYDIKVTNTSNLFGLLPDALYLNASPVWTTASGSLGSFTEQVSVSISATATDQENTAITYSLASGSSLPSGVTLNSSTGLISGTLPAISANTTYTFTINASDGVNVTPRTFSISSVDIPAATSFDALIIAGGGGGGGGYYGGGGGAGGVRQLSSISLTSNTCTVTVGNGGSGGAWGTRGLQGQSSLIAITSGTTYSATGGGGGAGTQGNGGGGQAATSGGSGGGGSLYTDYMNGAAGNAGGYSPVEGYAGGTGSGYQSNTNSNGGGAGGGGAGGAGESVVGSANRAGYGGMGITSTITGTSLKYAGGGGGGIWTGNRESGLYAEYGGGRGAENTNGAGFAATANTGGGGGAASGEQAGGAGGSGVVIIAYPNTYQPLVVGSGLTYDQPTRSGYRVYRFTAGTGTVTF
jgi:hypothetical protein